MRTDYVLIGFFMMLMGMLSRIAVIAMPGSPAATYYWVPDALVILLGTILFFKGILCREESD